MNRYKWDELDPFTKRQIELQPWDEDYGMNPPTLRTCGCERMREGRWSLCRYHEGVEDGTQNVDEKGLRLTIERLTAELAEMTANYTAALSLIDRMQADVEWSRRAGEMT